MASWSGSSGLGLPISKTLVELHGGHIEALSDLGKGTEFRFTLPQNQEVVSTAARSSSSPGKPVLSRLPSPAIVVAGQDPQAVNTMQRLAEGYTIVQATTCNQAVALLQEHQAVALIVPSSPDGIAYSDCPENVLMIECSLPGLQQAARTLGVLSVLEKPVQPTDLVKTLEAVVPPAKRILIVDDDVDLVQLFQRILAPSFGIENCLGAYSGAEALKILHQERIDVLLLDLAMPEIDGRDVLEALRRAQDLQHVQVIVISGTVQDAASVRVQKEIRLSRRGGLTMGEATRVITATATALSPGWHSLGPDTERFEQVPLADRLGQVGDST